MTTSPIQKGFAGIPHLPFAQAQAREKQLLAQVANAGQGWESEVWSTDQALIVPFSATHEADFENACQRMGEAGWPVLVRHTGGDVTPQSPNMVNVSFAFCLPRSDDLSIRETYLSFCQPILDFLKADLRINAYLASVDGAFCDGAYNVVVNGCKLAGTAQRWRLTKTPEGKPAVAVLGHAAILWDVDIAVSIAATNEFYKRSSVNRSVIAQKHTTVKCLIGEHASGVLPEVKSFDAFLKNYRSNWLREHGLNNFD
ncbi:MAG: lipoyl protein ligase domain-containing protein [Hyphomicrobiaceae bacterium]